MVLGKLPVLIWMIEGHEPTALAVGAGVFFVCFFFTFFFSCFFLPLSRRRPDID